MNIRFKINCLFLVSFLHFSCSSTSNMVLDFPEELITSDNTFHLKKGKGKGLVGTKRNLKFDKQYQGTLKEGWTITSDIVDKTPGGFFSEEGWERTMYYNLGIKIDDISSKRSDRFQITLSDTKQSWIGFCFQLHQGKSTSYNIFNAVDFSKGRIQRSDFRTSFISLTDSLSPVWSLELSYERETPEGLIQMFLSEGMPLEKGQLTNGADTISIAPLLVRGKELADNQFADIIKIVGGYEFVFNNKSIGIVDLYEQSISLMDSENPNNSIVAAAATALLLRAR